jgi:riboflavin kinase/FMN adenylyltransferase
MNGSPRKYFLPLNVYWLVYCSMQHYNTLESVSLEHSWLTIGVFDGVHIGHQHILSELKKGARSVQSPAVVLTFQPHPAKVLGRQNNLQLLNTPEERASRLAEFGADIVITQNFTRTLAETSAQDYLSLLQKHLRFTHLSVGHDFALGHNREGNVAFLRQAGLSMGFTIFEINPVKLDDEIISSSRIRNFLREGNISKANRYLGWNYELSGKVVPGDQRGRRIGIPTANLSIDPEKIIPAPGVYACLAFVNDQPMPAATNIGYRPTFDGVDQSLHLETHILDYEGDLYGQSIRLVFIDRLRGEQRFPDIASLVSQIREDIHRVRELTSSK